MRLYSRMRMRRYMYHNGLQIPWTVKIGYGLYIGHGFGTIVSERATIGNNVNLGQFTTVGATGEGAPVIGNNVYLGPAVCIVGKVRIGG